MNLLSIDDLQVEFRTEAGWTPVVTGAHLDLAAGGTRALVGESGSGKTVTALSILGLLPKHNSRVTRGTIDFAGENLLDADDARMRSIRGREIAMIFQEPMTSLNPVFTVGEQIAETVRAHMGSSRKQAWARAIEVLDLVGIPAAARRAKDYPHSFSGGMRQRAMIAMSIACDPKLLIADEPTTALDVTVQAGVLQLLRRLQSELGTAVLLVTHDLGVVADFCDEVTVMYAGEPVETAHADHLFAEPLHPYTAGLLESLPQRIAPGDDLVAIPGMVPRPEQMPSGCRFSPRCRHSVAGTCDGRHPELIEIRSDRSTRCVRVADHDLTGLLPALPIEAVPARSTIDSADLEASL
ncbi:ABC transporter ATP-binding protein [Rhodococcus sp. BP-252]|uniref:ABC transporter ATP-binding protein n=1 Tax=unclassified Rhodococcus (in: high G+C Gram-positive bacteria) TaxID=192944 RepID=UPI001430B2E6|nr:MULTISPECIES: ABC transporter ATP-binding protein [unclassified Rhodococcus (in: high G+C Gram-positive bacteria)]NIL75291.1 Oligopeptide transport ATP-binding protein OppD [Rhodococcus sp. B10]MBY6410834.1 ABC transporter ATP-binding protein [Rhodococcus sp. BP-320]MBY6415341.1 ABC transporter ATP-binding protein [Rhodococcus sp. BP-321]MBY6419956.1 ABC transporter ATP-binding protein [Rhodococcus sp. BP-324]MBY6425390.1 ABC transporter ATP-binding protein [Rhodococcus sp. BP-323]